MLVTSTQRRGGEVFGAHISDGLRERAWEVRLRALVRSEGPSIDARPLVDKPRDELRALDLQVIRALRHEINSFKPDVVFANGGATLPIAVGATALRRGAALIYGSIGEPLYWARSRWARLRTGLLMRRCHLITAISHPTRTQIVDGLGVSPERVVVAPSGVDSRFFDIESGGDAPHLRVLFLGSISPEKGPMSALDAFERASREAPMRMRFVGEGSLVDELADQVGSRRLGALVEIIGTVADVGPHLAWADVLVLPSETEGLPGAVLEAGAASVPTVAFDVGGVSDVVVDGETGVLVERSDVQGLSAGLVSMASDPAARDRFGRDVRKRVRAQFGLKASLDRYDELLRAVHEGRPVHIGES